MHYLTAHERLLIEIKRRQTRHKKEHVRLSVLLMLDEGFNNLTIALSQGIDADTIRNWKRNYDSVSRDLDRYLSDNNVAFQGYLSQEQLSALKPTCRNICIYVPARKATTCLSVRGWTIPMRV